MLASTYLDICREESRRYVSPRHGSIMGPNVNAYPHHLKPGMWAVKVGITDSRFVAFFDAVVDDFGDLVRVGPAIA